MFLLLSRFFILSMLLLSSVVLAKPTSWNVDPDFPSIIQVRDDRGKVIEVQVLSGEPWGTKIIEVSREIYRLPMVEISALPAVSQEGVLDFYRDDDNFFLPDLDEKELQFLQGLGEWRGAEVEEFPQKENSEKAPPPVVRENLRALKTIEKRRTVKDRLLHYHFECNKDHSPSSVRSRFFITKFRRKHSSEYPAEMEDYLGEFQLSSNNHLNPTIKGFFTKIKINQWNFSHCG